MIEFSSDWCNRPVLKNFEINPFHSMERVLGLFEYSRGKCLIEADFGFNIKWTTPSVQKWSSPLWYATKAIKFIQSYLDRSDIFAEYDVKIEHSILRRSSNLTIYYETTPTAQKPAFIVYTGIPKTENRCKIWNALYEQYGYFLKELSSELGTIKANEVCLKVKDLLSAT